MAPPIKVYAPLDARNKYRFTGGSLGTLYHTVVTGAKNFLGSPTGQKLKAGIKRKVLEAGSSIINDSLSGTPPIKALKRASKTLKKKIKKTDIRKVKRSILGRKKGGLLFGKVNRKKKKKSVGKKKSSKGQKKRKKNPKKKGKGKKRGSQKKKKSSKGKKKGKRKKKTSNARKKAKFGGTVFDF